VSQIAGWIALSLVPGVGSLAIRRLLAQFGDPETILAAPEAQLAAIVPPRVARAIVQDGQDAMLHATLSWLDAPGNQILPLSDSAYPQLLKETPAPPPVLYVKGRQELLNAPALAIVGSRNATPQGARNAERFAQSLSDSGFTIVSGLALGIDTAAHMGGLQGGASSVAVAGTGIDLIYPGRNRDLATRLMREGALVSELALGTPPLAGNFPRRNRIISGLCLGCLVVEAAAQSGSLITARLALEQGREVFAIPGSIHSPLSKGCHALIKEGAKLVETVDDVLSELRWPPQHKSAPPAGRNDLATEPLLALLGEDPCPLDALCARSGLSAGEIAVALLRLELDGRVAALPGGRYQRVD
jgi:DNA processing protein